VSSLPPQPAGPDAVISATGITEAADAVIGNDSRWKRVSEVRYLHLDELIEQQAAHDEDAQAEGVRSGDTA
jgi:hypothetical protein